jgi:hypothetical protein
MPSGQLACQIILFSFLQRKMLTLIFSLNIVMGFSSVFLHGLTIHNTYVVANADCGFSRVPYAPYVIGVSITGYRLCFTVPLRSAPDPMSFPRTSLFFYICVILIPIRIGFYIRLNPTILK